MKSKRREFQIVRQIRHTHYFQFKSNYKSFKIKFCNLFYWVSFLFVECELFFSSSYKMALQHANFIPSPFQRTLSYLVVYLLLGGNIRFTSNHCLPPYRSLFHSLSLSLYLFYFNDFPPVEELVVPLLLSFFCHFTLT